MTKVVETYSYAVDGWRLDEIDRALQRDAERDARRATPGLPKCPSAAKTTSLTTLAKVCRGSRAIRG